MLTVIGLIVWGLFTLGVTFMPFLIIKISALGGGLDYKIVLFCLLLFCLAIFSWANIFSVVDISMKGGDL